MEAIKWQCEECRNVAEQTPFYSGKTPMFECVSCQNSVRADNIRPVFGPREDRTDDFFRAMKK